MVLKFQLVLQQIEKGKYRWYNVFVLWYRFNKYVKYITLDVYNIRQFRLRSWLSDADFEDNNYRQLRYDIFMSNRGGLSIYAIAVPVDNEV